MSSPLPPAGTGPASGPLDRLVRAWVRAAGRLWPLVLIAALAASAAALAYVGENLGIHTDTEDMIAPDLDWRVVDIDHQRQFPHFIDNLAVVVEASTADLAAQAATRLATALRGETALFEWVAIPSDHPFLRRHALLYLDAAERDALTGDLVAAQPLLGRLHRDPGLAAVLDLLGDALARPDEVDPAVLSRFAGALALALEAARERRFHRLSWRELLGGDAAAGDPGAAPERVVVVASPVLDYRQLFPARAAMDRVRELAGELGLTPESGVRVRITGGLAMSDEELASVSAGAAHAAVLALVGVAAVLLLGLGSVRLVLATLITLVTGLVWTAAFAAAAVGHLNMISVAFAVLYIGLGVDYAVHFGLRYRELVNDHGNHAEALERAAHDVGAALALCALTTGVGFFAFLPTSFAGVSELGLIAGVGMFVSLVATLTLMPAMLTALRPRGGRLGRFGVGLPLAAGLDRIGREHPRAVAVVATLLAGACALLATQARFDDNPLNLREPEGEAVSTYRDLVASGVNWNLDVLVADLAAARTLAERLEALPEVRRVLHLGSLVPADQEAGLARVDELALLLGPDLAGPPAEPADPALAGPALARLDAALADAALRDPALARLRETVAALQADLAGASPEGRKQLLAAAQEAVTGTLPDELARLGELLDAGPVSVDDLPGDLARDWRAPDGRVRLRVDAAGDLNDPRSLEAFVAAVRGVAPGAIGVPVIHVESARAVVDAFRTAFGLALACITLILWLILRRPGDVAVVLAPLLLAALASAAALVLMDMPFNFANVIALPLLLGVGVDSGIHMLNRARRGGGALAGSSTARGVLTSALTTTVSFGNLAFSAHPGTASMGLLLTVGMVATLVCTLLVLPAVASLPARWRGGTGT